MTIFWTQIKKGQPRTLVTCIGDIRGNGDRTGNEAAKSGTNADPTLPMSTMVDDKDACGRVTQVPWDCSERVLVSRFVRKRKEGSAARLRPTGHPALHTYQRPSFLRAFLNDPTSSFGLSGVRTVREATAKHGCRHRYIAGTTTTT